PISSRSTVEPFLCPDHMRARLLREIAFAHSSIALEVYILSDPAIAGALASASSRGVQVRTLVEGEPVGGLSSAQVSFLQALGKAGCEVFQSFGFHGFKRYDYLHPKFMVVDGRRVLLASENFASSSLDSNRGWGICIESQEVAVAFLSVFDGDVDPRFPDIRRMDPASATTAPSFDWPVLDPDVPAPDSFPAQVETVLAPDFGYDSTLGLIKGATDRLYLELYYMSDQWRQEQDPYLSILDAARRGVSVRLLLDGNWYNNEEGKGNAALAQKLNEAAAQERLDLQAKTLSPFHDVETLHNKGVIADGKVLVCSINWVRASFERNREAGAIIDSAQVADFFAKSFQEDWVDDAIAPELVVPSYLEVDEGRQVVLNATASDNSGSVAVVWDVGGDGKVEGEGPFFFAELPPGEFFIEVTASDPSNNSCMKVVRVMILPRQGDDPRYYGLAVAAVISVAVWFVRKRVKRA
ncbi:MAG: phospholipase D-like domain-containing protein, partial [Methanomassiliicoccales archaeon]|nr:phospholipase D-like domain-containing protein [Methanomassiliicoccales archaeon]